MFLVLSNFARKGWGLRSKCLSARSEAKAVDDELNTGSLLG
jgi:hypothetical protein